MCAGSALHDARSRARPSPSSHASAPCLVFVRACCALAVRTADQLKFASVRERLTLSTVSASRAEVQVVNLTNAASGAFMLTFDGTTSFTDTIPFNADAATFKSKLLAAFGGSIRGCASSNVDVSRSIVRRCRVIILTA